MKSYKVLFYKSISQLKLWCGLSLLLFLFSSCENDLLDNITGLKPIYSSELPAINYKSEPRNIIQTGKIVYQHPYIFISELDRGIHVIDNRDPENPNFQGFIEIPYSLNFAMKGDILFVNSGKDIVSLKFDGNSVQEIARMKNVNSFDQSVNADYTGYFECVDDSKGYVIGWEETELTNEICFK